MNNTDLLLLTIYILCVTYVLYQIINSFNDELTIVLEKKDLDKQLEDLKLNDRVEVSFKFDKRYEFDKLKEFGVNVKNKSKEHPVFVDWNMSSVTDLDGKARRVTRLIAGNSLDLFQEQALSPVPPGTTMKEKVVAEDMLARKGDDGPMEVSKTLVDLSKPKKPGDPLKRYLDFVAMQRTLEISLSLMVRFVGDGSPATGYPIPINCKFTLRKLDWKAGLPWNPKED
jgi:hypothetical protein